MCGRGLITLFVEHIERDGGTYWHRDGALLLYVVWATKVETATLTCHEVQENRTAHGEQMSAAAVIIIAVVIMK
jgi:hypothetical protein